MPLSLEMAVIASLAVFSASFLALAVSFTRAMKSSGEPGKRGLHEFEHRMKWLKIWLVVTILAAILLSTVSVIGANRWG